MYKMFFLALFAGLFGLAQAQSAVERQALTLNFGDFQSKAELTYPAQGGPFPTVILIHGSTPMDMDAGVFGRGPNGQPVKLSAIFKDISEFLSARGFAVLRYNKHYVSGPGQADFQSFYSKLTLQQMLADAQTALEAAKANPKVDKRKIFLYGWSEGSTVAAALAAQHPELAGLVVQGPVALPWRDLFAYQIEQVGLPYLSNFAQDGKVTDATLVAALQGNGGLVAQSVLNYIADPQAFQQGRIAINPTLDTNKNGALDLASELSPQVFGRMLDAAFSPQGFFTIYAPGRALPTATEQAPSLKMPVLILQGANDANVPAQGARALDEALAKSGNPRHLLKIYEGLGHSLGTASSPLDDNFRPIQTAPLQDLAAWLTERSRG
ncbi:MAG TPA: alpha/beta fold hydrolase [Meiothermus sp.]|nr:alpha/beta fold hydrolase [Meiothermus sp.]